MFQSSSRGVASFILYFPRPPYIPKILFDTISEGILGGEGLTYSHLAYLSESISLALDSTNSSAITSQSIIDIIRNVDSINILLNGGITESVLITSSASNILNRAIAIQEVVNLNDTAFSRAVYLTLVLELLNILDLVNHGKLGVITESLLLQNSISSLSSLANTLAESLGLIDTLSSRYIRLVSLSETLNLSNTLSSLLLGKEKVAESFVLSIPTVSGQDNYLAYLLSPETMSISNYNNYNFDGCTKFRDDYLFFNSTGLYKYGGKDDDGDKFSAYVQTTAFNFGSSNLKQVPAVYLGHTCSGESYLKVKTDGRKEAHYKLNKKTENLNTQKIDVGKGLISRYFQFELVTDADDFSMESIDFYPLELRRKI
jgi:hypothetical protein